MYPPKYEYNDQDGRKEESERSQKTRNGLTTATDILEGNTEGNNNFMNYGNESNADMDPDESDHGTMVSDERI